MNLKKLLFILPYLFVQTVWAQADWQKIKTIDEVCVAYPEPIKSIFQNLDLNYPGLEKVKKAYEANNIPQACKNLLEYYSRSKRVRKDLPPASVETTAAGDSVLQDIYTFQKVSDKVPRLANGHLKWTHNGPDNDIEWAWALNRHYPTEDLLNAYFKTGNLNYIKYIDQFTKDWIISSWPYPGTKSNTAMWRGLEVSFRVKTWSRIFFELWNTKLISPATKLLILSSLPDHAHYARNFHAQGNWLTMEISGLATVASSWPELKDSKNWIDYSIATMVASMKEQVYPDGVQTELTSHYHRVALENFSSFKQICDQGKQTLPEYYNKQIENMWNYLAYSLKPDGYSPLNNDADLDNNRDLVLKAAAKNHRDDWIFIASNGQQGAKPQTGPSVFFPWAGQLIMRSGYDTDAQWAFFDIGPWGTGHQHNDKLHLSVAAYGRDLLVDAGRFAYRGKVADRFRSYACGSAGHNLILIDGKGQAPGDKLTEKPLSETNCKTTATFDYAWGSFDKFTGVEGKCVHTRSLLYVRGKFWIVVDHISTDRPHQIETLWHWHPACKVIYGDNQNVSTQNNRGNLKIIPVGPTYWAISHVKGQEKPQIQGWYSKAYNEFEPNPTTIYTTKIQKSTSFVWILWPSEGKAPDISATIVKENEAEISLQVTNGTNEQWNIVVPFSDSNKADCRVSRKRD